MKEQPKTQIRLVATISVYDGRMTDLEKAVAVVEFVKGSGISSDALRADALVAQAFLTEIGEVDEEMLARGHRLLDFVHACGETSDDERGWAQDMATLLHETYEAQ